MKIAPLLAQYLYTNGKLNLPGIGTFFLENLSALPTIDSKNKTSLLEGVSFNHDKNTREDAELIAYISAQTGKIKPLASADLESHLELAKQFLNIGKPFLFEGIGTLSKKGNEFNFSSGIMIAEPVKEQSIREAVHQQAADDTGSYSDVFYAKKNAAKNAWKKPAIFFLVVAGLILAVWGGYKVYKNSATNNETTDSTKADNTLQPSRDNNTDNTNPQVQKNIDTTKLVNTPVAQPNGSFATGTWKFVVETANRERALRRFSKLQTIGVKNVMMETKDSVSFNIYFAIPASVADTARILDSLRRNYTPGGARAFIGN